MEKIFKYKHKPLEHYKNEENVFNDLIKKYFKYGSLYIGVDFDNTLLPYGQKDYDENTLKGYYDIIDLLKKCKEAGFKLCLWSLSTSQENLEWKIKWCKEHDIKMDYINESPLMKEYDNVTGKPHFNLLLDDVAGLESAHSILSNLIEYLNIMKIKTLEDLNQENSDIYAEIKLKRNNINDLKIACSVLQKHDFIAEQQTFIKEIEKIEKEIEDLKNQQQNIENEILKLRETCLHDFVYVGHDSHHSYYVCKKCGKEEKD